MSNPKKVILVIMDGWGLGKRASSDSIQNARVPFVSSLYALYPNTTLVTYGEEVGLPEGQMGNSEVGHLNLGAGRIGYQDLTRINKAIADGELKTNGVLQEAFAKAGGHRLHFLGLLSDGGVHSHLNPLIALTKVAKESGVEEILIHAITDGRD